MNTKISLFHIFLFFFFPNGFDAVARFAIKSVSTRSVVIEMVDAHNVSRFDMRVLIYDLEKLREFRRSELTGARYNAQLFSFDGLIPGNWFAFRIEYRLVYDHGKKASRGSSMDGTTAAYFSKDLSTKQEIVVQTRREIKGSGKGPISSELPSSDIHDEVVQFDRIQLFPELHQLNLTLKPVLKHRERISTLVVAELRCARGTVKPQAQQVPDKGLTLSFDLSRVHPGALSYRNALSRLKCLDLCIFPFIRIEPPMAAQSGENHAANHRHTFRAREICESLQQEDAGPAAPGKKWPGAMGDEVEEKLLDRHFRSSLSSTSGIGTTNGRLFLMRSIIIFLLFAYFPNIILPF